MDPSVDAGCDGPVAPILRPHLVMPCDRLQQCFATLSRVKGQPMSTDVIGNFRVLLQTDIAKILMLAFVTSEIDEDRIDKRRAPCARLAKWLAI
jgi:hypothetical protein